MVIVVVASAICTAHGDETSPGGEAKTLTVAVVSSRSDFWKDRKEKMIVVEVKRPLAVLVPPCELRRLHRR
jgi:hypothetical protein